MSCSESPVFSEKSEPGLSPTGKLANIEKAATYDLITLEIGTALSNIAISDHDLHGKFFSDRAEFYVIENPELYVSNTEVEELTLYFIDSTLCKKKYKLADDISAELMKSYGAFKFTPLNRHTKELSKTESIVLKTASGIRINKKLNRYQMKWDEREVLIKYRLSRDSTEIEIYLEEELGAYKHLLRFAEQDLI